MNLEIVQFDTALHWDWCSRVIQAKWCEDTCGVVAIDDYGYPHGAMLADHVTRTSADCHMGADSPMVWRSGLLQAGCEYVFGIVGLERVFGMTPDSNYRAIAMAKRIGFRETVRLTERYGPGVDGVLLEMRAQECRYLHRLSEVA